MARQNLAANKPVFRAANVHMIMEPVRIIADEIFIQIRTPLLMDFLHALRGESEAWARELLMKISEVIEEEALDAWAYTIDRENCPAICDSLGEDWAVELGHLCRDPRRREEVMPVLPLLLRRDGEQTLLPAPSTPLRRGDELLIGGRHSAQYFMSWITQNHNVLRYIQSGREAPGGLIWKWLASR